MNEVVGKRTRNSKTHLVETLPDGRQRFFWDGTIGSIHYEDNGWQEIDNIFESAAAPWDWQMLQAGYHIRVKEDFTAGQIIEFEKQGETAQFQPMALEWTNDLDQIQQISMPQNVPVVVSNPVVDMLPAVGMPGHRGTIRWDNGYGQGIDFEWKCIPTRLVKILEIETLARLPTPQQYIIDGGNPVLRLNLIFAPSSGVDIYIDGSLWDKNTKRETFSVIEFRKNGEVLWVFMPLRYWDSAENEGQSIATVERRGNSLYISIRVPYPWLQGAVYPVFIDVDVDETVGAQADDASEYGNGTFSITLTSDRMSSDSPVTEPTYQCGGLRFQTVDVPNAAIIGTAYIEVYVASTSYDDPEGAIFAHDTDDAADFTANANIISQVQRPRTAASAAWSARGIGVGWKGNTISLTNVIKEIVDRGGWAANQDMVILLIATIQITEYNLRWDSWDNASGNDPKLHIEYAAGGGGGGSGGAGVVTGGAARLLV